MFDFLFPLWATVGVTAKQHEEAAVSVLVHVHCIIPAVSQTMVINKTSVQLYIKMLHNEPGKGDK